MKYATQKMRVVIVTRTISDLTEAIAAGLWC
jgi:hypothetical protein